MNGSLIILQINLLLFMENYIQIKNRKDIQELTIQCE